MPTAPYLSSWSLANVAGTMYLSPGSPVYASIPSSATMMSPTSATHSIWRAGPRSSQASEPPMTTTSPRARSATTGALSPDWISSEPRRNAAPARRPKPKPSGVRAQAGRFVFEIGSPHTRLESVGTPGRRGWRLLVHRRGLAPFPITGAMVDPETLLEALRYYRPDL